MSAFPLAGYAAALASARPQASPTGCSLVPCRHQRPVSTLSLQARAWELNWPCWSDLHTLRSLALSACIRASQQIGPMQPMPGKPAIRPSGEMALVGLSLGGLRSCPGKRTASGEPHLLLPHSLQAGGRVCAQPLPTACCMTANLAGAL